MQAIRDRLLMVLLPPIMGLIAILLLLTFFSTDEIKPWIFWIAGFSCFWLLGSVWFISYNISDPIRKLKDQALHLASGDYEEEISSEGPQEIKELAGTLNTMRECLRENISRLTDYPLAREKLYGEYECAELIQYEMLDKALETIPEDQWAWEKVCLKSNPQMGILFEFDNDTVHIKEAEREGFQGIFELLTEGSTKEGRFNLKTGDTKFVKLPPPLLWSDKDQALLPFKAPKSGDIVILFNSGLKKQMPHPNILKDWFQKILKHFAKDGLELTKAMMESELKFFAKKYLHHEDITIILITPK
ncbi:MAG: HAMP domain-containing protein [Chlamydiia bacterium]|nr:HAMP domain-containing protein [Chlamydiia bacterium]